MKPVALFALATFFFALPHVSYAFGNGADINDRRIGHEDLTITGPKDAHIFHVEIATTPADQERGLMFRQSVPADTGMLFMFPDEDEREFWMKNTLVPLDMVFINAKGEIIHIHENARPNDLTPIPSEGPARAVLELAGGTTARLGIHSGDKIKDQSVFQQKFRWH